MILADNDIQVLQSERGPIVPFSEGRLRGASYDIALGGTAWVLRVSDGVVGLSNQGQLDAPYKEVDIESGLTLKPGQYVLVNLEETISLPGDLVAYVMPRTRLTRMGLIVSNQFCNPGYQGHLSVGLHNASGNMLAISSGLVVGQFAFERLAGVPSAGRLYRNKQNAAYQNEEEFGGARFEERDLSPRAGDLSGDGAQTLGRRQ